jgi:hypothetical protein
VCFITFIDHDDQPTTIYDCIDTPILRDLYDELRVCNRFATDLQSLGAASDTLLQDIEGTIAHRERDAGDARTMPQVIATLNEHAQYLEVAQISSDSETGNRIMYFNVRGMGGGRWSHQTMRSPYVEPLCYPVLFPFGENGWGEDIADQVSFYSYLASRLLMPEDVGGTTLFAQTITG